MSDSEKKEGSCLGTVKFTNAIINDFAGVDGNLGAIAMLLPPNDGFSPNVNVLEQASGISMEEYMAISTAQMQQMGVTITASEIVDDTTMAMTYHGITPSAPDLHLHVTLRVIKDAGRGRFVVASATVLHSMATSEDPVCVDYTQRVRTCVSSLSIEALEGEGEGEGKLDRGAWNIDMLIRENDHGSRLTMSAHPRNGFATNIIMMDDVLNGDVKQYMANEEANLVAAGFSEISVEQVSSYAVAMRFSKPADGNCWEMKAVLDPVKMRVVSAIATLKALDAEIGHPEIKVIRACLASLQLVDPAPLADEQLATVPPEWEDGEEEFAPF